MQQHQIQPNEKKSDMMNREDITQMSATTNNVKSDLDMAKATVDNIPNLPMESSGKKDQAALPVQRKRERLHQFKSKAMIMLMMI